MTSVLSVLVCTLRRKSGSGQEGAQLHPHRIADSDHAVVEDLGFELGAVLRLVAESTSPSKR